MSVDGAGRFCEAVFLVCLVLPSAATRLLQAEETLADRRARLAELSPAEKRALREKKERFDKLDPREKEHLWRVHRELSAIADPKRAERLRQVMVRYNEWLKMLSSGERSRLLAMAPDERIQRIKQLKLEQEQEQERQRFRRLASVRLGPDDVRAFFTWLHDFAERHQAEILAELPDDVRKKVQELDPKWRYRAMMFAAIRYRDKLPAPGEDDIKRLSEQLSGEARKALDSLPDPQQKMLLVQKWVQLAVFSHISHRGYGRPMPPVSDEELQRFYTEKLDARQREYLESLPRDRLHGELRRLYYANRYRSPGGQRPHGPPGKRSAGPRELPHHHP